MSDQQSPRELRSSVKSIAKTTSIHQNTPAGSATTKGDFLKNIEMRLNNRLDEHNAQLKSLITELHNNLADKLDTIVSDFNRRFEDINRTLSALTVRVEVLEQTSEATICSQLETEILTLRRDLDQVQREKLSTDLVLHGVPKNSNEDLHNIFEKLCSSIDCAPIPLPRDIFRTKPKRGSEDTAIIIKLPTTADKIRVLRSIHLSYQKTKKPICLRNLALQSDSRIYLNESLTAQNHLIYRKAYKLKQQKHLSSVFTRNGLVYARQTPKGKAFLFDCPQRLDDFAAAMPAINDEFA